MFECLFVFIYDRKWCQLSQPRHVAVADLTHAFVYCVNPLESKGNYCATSNNTKLVHTGRWWVGCYIQRWGDWAGPQPARPSPLLAVPNVTAHPSTASVPIRIAVRCCAVYEHKGLMARCAMVAVVSPSSVVRPVVISRKLSKIDTYNAIRKLESLILLPQSDPATDVPLGRYCKAFNYKTFANINAPFCSTWRQTRPQLL